MPKSSVTKIEEDEKKILKELRKNANKSITDISESLGFSRQKVWRIIKNLEENNTIWGYTAVLDNEKLNKKSYMLLIKKSNKAFTEKLIDDIITRNVPEEVKHKGIDMECSFFTHGVFDWVICFTANDLKDAKWYVEYYNRLYQDFLSEIHLMDVMFSAVCSNLVNPEMDKLKDFFKV